MPESYKEGQTAGGGKYIFHGGAWVDAAPVRTPAPEYGLTAFRGPQGEVLQIDPKTGMSHQVAPSMDADALKEVQALHGDIQKLEGLTSNDSQFLAHNKKRGTGGIGEWGGHANPVYEFNRRTDPHMGAMSSIAAQETFQMRPDGSGRVLQSEIPIFQSEALSPEVTGPVNESRARIHGIQLEIARQKLSTMEEHKRQTGRYTGYEQKWTPRLNEMLGRFADEVGGNQGNAGGAAPPKRKSLQAIFGH